MTAATSLRLVAAARAGARLVARPRGVVHVAPAGTPVTPSGAALRSGGRAVCRGRTGRLYVFTSGVSDVQSSGRRFCRRCLAVLPVSLGIGGVDQLRTRDDDLAAYGHLTVADLTVAAGWCRTVEETHQVARVALVVHGASPIHRPKDQASPAYGMWVFEQTLLNRRRTLTVRALTPEQLAAAEAEREQQNLNDELARRGRATAARQDRLTDRARQGRYLTRAERDEIGLTA